jgi:hypothetical protein
MKHFLQTLVIVASIGMISLSATFAAPAKMHKTSTQTMMHNYPKGMMVGYDAKDKKYYSVAYAKSHGMHDRGGDPLTIVLMSSLPKTAKMSHAMHGKM